MVGGPPVRGAAFLSESLANYSAMMVTEKTYGLEAARKVYDFYMERYLRGRATQAREVPVLEVEDQPYIAYRKGALALYTLRDHIGEDAVNGALRRYFEEYRDAVPPYPTSLDLYAELRTVTPDSLQSLLTDWFETITLWDVSTERVVVEPTGTGEYVVTLDVVARKMRADGEGNETEVPMEDLVEIGIFAPGEGGGLGRAAVPAAAPHPQRRADDPHHRRAGAGRRRDRSLAKAHRSATRRQRRSRGNGPDRSRRRMNNRTSWTLAPKEAIAGARTALEIAEAS